MNYIERIQKSIDFIEANLQTKITITKLADKAFMSLSSFYRLFFALVGYSVKEYIRLRRVSMAAVELKANSTRVIDIAVKYDFTSSDAFSRAFKRLTGMLPSTYKHSKDVFIFERIDLMDKYYEIQDQYLLKKYPSIKLLKKIEDLRVAYYCYYGENPETNAFKVMSDWLTSSGIDPNKQRLRIFGYNNPSPNSPVQKEYGYEVCVTISDDIVVTHDKVKVKTLKSGLYAILGVKFKNIKDVGNVMFQAWETIKKWLNESKYEYDPNLQWLEEHLSFNNELTEFKGMDIYVPVKQKII